MSSPTRVQVASALAVQEPDAMAMADELARQLSDLVEQLLTARLAIGAEQSRSEAMRTLQRYQVWRRPLRAAR